jgi:putative ABC transport system substrate-binding protein
MRRRDFLTLLGGAVGWPLAARAQQPGKLPTIGFLGTMTPSARDPFAAAFVRRLHELGWIEGRTVAIEFRWSEHRTERHRELVADLVRLKVDVIVTTGGAVSAAKEATSSIPIVFALAPDPVGSGLVASLARPGGNVTGLTNQQTDVVGKRLELLREVVSDLRRVAILVNVSYPITVPEAGDVRAAAGTLGLDVVTLEIRQGSDIAPAIDTLQGRAEALYVVGTRLSQSIAPASPFWRRAHGSQR